MATRTRQQTMYNHYRYDMTRTGHAPSGYSGQLKTVYGSSRTGVALPRWQSVIKDGGNATTPLSAYESRCSVESGLHISFEGEFSRQPGYPVDRITETYSSDGAIGYFDSSFWLYPSIQAADAQALTKAYQWLEAQRNHFQGVTALGELGETIKSFKRPYSHIVREIDSYLTTLKNRKRGLRGSKRKRVRQWDRILADTWLETSFGLLPLISDAGELAETVARFENDRVRKVGSADGRSQLGDSQSSDGVLAGNYLRYTQTRQRVATLTIRYKIGIDASYYAAFGSAARLAQLSGFDPRSFVPQAYNVLPWTWLVDYISNLGDVINSSCACQANVSWVCRTQRCETVASYHVQPYTSFGAPHKVLRNFAVPGRYKVVSKTLSRAPYTKLPWVPLLFELPVRPVQYANVLAVFRKQVRDLFIEEI